MKISIEDMALELKPLSIEDCTDSTLVRDLYDSLINLANKKLDNNGTLYSENKLIPINYVKMLNGIYLFPDFNPQNELDVTITGVMPVFNNRCSLITCNYKGKNFMFFNPEPLKEDILKSKRTIKIAAISNSFRVENKKGEKYKEKELIQYSNSSPIYENLFQIMGIKEIKGNYANLSVRNPLDLTKSLELITAVEDPNNLFSTKSIETDFYFIGKIKD